MPSGYIIRCTAASTMPSWLDKKLLKIDRVIAIYFPC
jgi:hypothetical protein